jgi:hypothetical protein
MEHVMYRAREQAQRVILLFAYRFLKHFSLVFGAYLAIFRSTVGDFSVLGDVYVERGRVNPTTIRSKPS